MALPLKGTGDVTDGNTVAWTGATLTSYNCYPGFPVVINKQATFVDTRIDTSHFTVDPPVDDGTDLSIAIAALTSQMTSVAELNTRAAELLYNLSVSDANGRGFWYKLLDVTGANDPGPGYLARSHTTWSAVTALYLDALDLNNQATLARLQLLAVDSVLVIRSLTTTAFAAYKLTGEPVLQDTDEWVSIPVIFLEGDGLLADDEEVSVEWNRAGPAGADGEDGTDGADGEDGTNGAGVPTGGTANQLLHKVSGTDYDTGWTSAPLVTSLDVNNADTTLSRLSAGVLGVEGTVLLKGGRQSMYIPASGMYPRATSPAEEIDYDSGSNDVTIKALAFDTTTQEYAQFEVVMPKSWDFGTVTFRPYWTNTGGATTQTVRWTLAGVAIADDEALNATVGTAGNSDDTWLAQNDLHVGPESSAITIGGSPADGKLIIFQVSRDVANDNMAGDAVLLGIMLFFTVDKANDA